MAKPIRLRLSRAKGFDLQAHSRKLNGLDAVNVARPSTFGNPFVVGKDGDRAACVDLFGAMINGLVAITATPAPDEIKLRRAAIVGNIRQLTGKNLACWCQLDGKPCHADTLLTIANDPEKLAVCDRISGKEAKP
jgi:hypothetical protein